eukprot:CAMPEP_0184289912 /NCGR_PEP_ID=MMETSP1049-20130417/2283_1 /TAXON_ID=77928 /ORGANISM="Proteomonas sulcata, Strain CCMP704" /LENGTH=71 /DNA_ID=CAMNT_0026596899 /DNA_START=352 /DNA_END=567 /DNA_ORIENTATION=+
MDMEQENVPQKRKPNYMMMTPLIWAPTLPMVRIVMKNSPPALRDKVFLSFVGLAFSHGVYVILNQKTWIMR